MELVVQPIFELSGDTVSEVVECCLTNPENVAEFEDLEVTDAFVQELAKAIYGMYPGLEDDRPKRAKVVKVSLGNLTTKFVVGEMSIAGVRTCGPAPSVQFGA